LRRTDPLTIAVLAYTGLTVVATILSIDPGHSLAGEKFQYQGLFSSLAYVVLFMAARLSVTSVARVQGVALGLLASAAIAAAYAIAQAVSLAPVWTSLYKDRPFSTMGQASSLASVFGMATLLSLSLVVGRPRAEHAGGVGSASFSARG